MNIKKLVELMKDRPALYEPQKLRWMINIEEIWYKISVTSSVAVGDRFYHLAIHRESGQVRRMDFWRHDLVETDCEALDEIIELQKRLNADHAMKMIFK